MTSRSLATPIRCAAAALALLALSARADQGFYLGGIGGVTLDPDTRITVSDAFGNVDSAKAEFDEGPSGSIVAGYTFASGLRAELEGGYRRSEFSAGGGSTAASQAIASAYYNFSRRGYYFYLGGGGGYANLRLDVDGAKRDDDGTPVYSIGTGFGLPVGKQLMVGVDYRYVGAFDRTNYSYTIDGDAIDASLKYRSHFIGLGLRYSFGSALADSHPVRQPSEPVSVVPVGN